MLARVFLFSVFLTLSGFFTVEAKSVPTTAVQRHIGINGLDRTYWLYRPAVLGEQHPIPLVIMLHGGFGSGLQAERSYGWDNVADANGFVVAYPDGIGHSWNAGGTCCGPAIRDAIDDLTFITQLIQALVQSENIDPKRIYLTGMSNGAAMSYRYACEGSYPIAAIGSVAGSLSFTCPNPQQAPSIMEIHGLEDHNIPLAGGLGLKGVSKVNWLPVQKTLDTFREEANCHSPTVRQTGAVVTATSSCSAGRSVKLVTVEGAGHQWPGGHSKNRFVDHLLDLDQPSTALDATNTLWHFFQNRSSP